MPFLANGDYELSLKYPKIFNIGPEGGILEYVRYLYFLGLVFIGATALFALVYGGLMYMTSDVITSKEEAKKWMLGAVTGLSLGFLSYLILFTINPDLVKWKLKIKEAKLPPPIIHITCPSIFIERDSAYYRYEYPLKAEGCTYCAEKWEYDDSNTCRHAQELIDCGNEIPEEYKNLHCEKICCKKKVTEYHLVCKNGKCKKTPGPGPDDLSCKGKEKDDECEESKKYHLVCRNQMCLLVEGEGEDDSLCRGKKQGDECGEETTWSCEDPGGGICALSKEECYDMGWKVATEENTNCPDEKPYCCKPQEYTCTEDTMTCVKDTQCPSDFPILRTDKTCPTIGGKPQICCEQSECQKKGYPCKFLVCPLPYEQMPFDCGSSDLVCCGIYSCGIQYGGTCYFGGCPEGTELIPEGSCKPGYVCCGATEPLPPLPPEE